MKSLMKEMEHVEKELTRLLDKEDAWPKAHQDATLSDNQRWLITYFKRIEQAINITLFDCQILGKQYWKDHNLPAIESLHRSFIHMERLFKNLHMLKKNYEAGLMNYSALRRLLADWARFKKSLLRAHKSIQKYKQRRKKTPPTNTKPFKIVMIW